MKINTQSGLPLQIYIPNIQSAQAFELEFYTNPTVAKGLNIVVAYDGQEYVGCQPWSHGVYFYSEKKFTNAGEIFCRATYYVPNPLGAEGFQKVVFDNLDTGIEIVEVGGDYFDPLPDPSKLEIPSFNVPCGSRVPVFMTFYPMGSRGEAGMDYFIDQEQEVFGEFFAGRDNLRKQVYVCRVFCSKKLGLTSIPQAFFPNLFRADSIISVDGFIIVPNNESGVFTEQQIPVGAGIMNGRGWKFYAGLIYDSSYWGNNYFGVEVTAENSVMGGRDVTLNLYVKYTKF